MTTLSATKARGNLSLWLRKAAQGEDIGILFGDKIIALRPVTVTSDDYAIREYGVTEQELDHFVNKAHSEIRRDKKAGKVKTFKGNIEELLKD